MFSTLSSKLALRILLILVSSCFLITSVRGQKYPDSGEAGTGGNNMILGNVFLPTGQRVDRPIRVRLLTMTRGDMTTMTTNDGSFSFRRLATGTYTVVIDGEEDYEPVSQSVFILQATRS